MKKNVLIVDDDADIRQLLQMTLESLGCKVKTAADGQEALTEIQIQRPDLILLDIKMPRLNGYHLFAQLKAHTDFGSIPIIVITGLSQNTEHDDDEWARRMGADAFLTKPFDLEELGQRVRELVAKFL